MKIGHTFFVPGLARVRIPSQVSELLPIQLRILAGGFALTAWYLIAVLNPAICTAARGPVFQEEEKATVEVVEATRGDLNESVELPATVRGYRTADLFSKVGGYLKEINVDIGDKVTAGQVLATLDIPEMKAEMLQRKAMVAQAEAEVRQAAAAIDQAKAKLVSQEALVEESRTLLLQKRTLAQFEETEFQRINSLVMRGAVNRELLDAARLKRDSANAEIAAAESHVKTVEATLIGSKAEIAKTEADLASAESRVEVAQANQDYTDEMMKYAEIKAPFDGLVSKRWYDSGAFIQSAEGNSAAKPVLQVLRNDKVRVSIKVSMAQVNMVDRGDKVLIRDIDGLEGNTFAGEVSRMSAEVDPQSRMMEIEVDLDNQSGRLKPGYFGYAEIELVNVVDKVLVPNASVVYGEQESVVFVVENSKAVSKPVVVADHDSKHTAIESGVSAGDKLIANAAGIRDGQTVISK